ncbi:ribosomal protein S18 [Xylaria sp. FL1777]|nr:ribosomal protein S18 [Xylaria sp. FL1777]
MPPRIPVLSALRQGMSMLKTPTAPLSTTAAPQALRDLRNTTSSMLDIDGAPRNSAADSTQLAGEMYSRIRSTRPVARRGENRKNADEALREKTRAGDFIRQMPRRWRVGDVYAPHDMSPSEMAKWRRSTGRKQDLVDMLGLRPLDMYRNFSVISEFITPHGRIMRSVETGLSPVNQRKMAKAIRRAIGLGLHPSVHRHPELLVREPNKVLAQNMVSRTSTKLGYI